MSRFRKHQVSIDIKNYTLEIFQITTFSFAEIFNLN